MHFIQCKLWKCWVGVSWNRRIIFYIFASFWSQTYFVFFLSADKSELCVGSLLLMDPGETLAPGHPKPPPPHLSEVGGLPVVETRHFKTNSQRALENGGGWPEARQMKSSPSPEKKRWWKSSSMGLESRHKEEEADTESHYCRIRKQFGLEEPTHSMLNTHPGSAPLPWKHALQTSSHMLHQHRESSREYLSIDWFYNILHKVFTLGWDVKVGMLVKSWQSEMENRFSHSVFLPVSQLSAGTQSTDVEPKMKQKDPKFPHLTDFTYNVSLFWLPWSQKIINYEGFLHV